MLSANQKTRHARAYIRGVVQREGGPEKVTKERLRQLTDRLQITVERGDGQSGDPLKSDYLSALGL